MLKIMANENMEEWHSSVAGIDETVRAVRRFLNSSQDESTTDTNSDDYIGYKEVMNFLGWDKQRVQTSFTRINAVNDSGVDRKAMESIPTAKAATTFASKVKAHDLSPKQQRKVAERIKASENYSPDAVTKEIMKEAYQPSKFKKVEKEIEQKKLADFDEYLEILAKRAVEMKDEIAMLKSLKKEIIEYSYDQFENRLYLKLSLESLSKTITNLITDLNDE
jgi:hypothetical protein